MLAPLIEVLILNSILYWEAINVFILKVGRQIVNFVISIGFIFVGVDIVFPVITLSIFVLIIIGRIILAVKVLIVIRIV